MKMERAFAIYTGPSERDLAHGRPRARLLISQKCIVPALAVEFESAEMCEIVAIY